MAQRAILRSFAPGARGLGRQVEYSATRAFSAGAHPNTKPGTPFYKYLHKNPATIGPSQAMGILDTTLTLLETGVPAMELQMVRQSSGE
jgi:hypothetical protein